MDHVLEPELHVIAQIVEAEFVVRTVGDVGEIRVAPLERAGLGLVDAPDGEPQVLVHVTHPLRIAAGEVRIHGDEMRALSRK